MKHISILTCALVGLTTFFWSASQLTHLSTEYSLGQFYPKSHPLLLGDDEIKQTFRLHSESPYLFVIELKNGTSWANPKNIDSLRNLSAEIQGREDVSSVIDLIQVEGAGFSKDALTVGNIFDRTPQVHWRRELLSNPLTYPLLVSQDLFSSLVVIEPKVKETTARMMLEKELIKKIQSTYPHARVHSAGVPLIQTRLSGMIQSELALFLVLLTLAFCGLFYFLFAHWSSVACALLTLIASNVFALALLVHWGIPMNVLLVTLPVIVGVSTMSLLVHTLHLWAVKSEKEQTLKERVQSTKLTLKELFLPNSLGILTTALGFLALTPSGIPLISEYGLTVALCLLLVSVYDQLLMFIFLPFVKSQGRAWSHRSPTWILWSTKHPTLILITTIFIIGFSGHYVGRLNFSTKLFDDLPKSDQTYQATQRIDDAFGGMVPYEVSLKAPQSNFWKNPDTLRQLNALAQELRTINGVGNALTVADFFQDGIPKTSQEIAEVFFLFSMAQKNPLQNFLSEDASLTRISLRFQDRPSAELLQTREQVESLVRKAFPEMSLTLGGIAAFAPMINEEVSRALIFEFWQPLLLIGLFLVLLFRSLKWAILSCLPNFIPPAALIVALGISESPIKPAIALIFSIALGFAFNNTLYILNRLKLEARSGETDILQKALLQKALLQEAYPCLFESLIMFVGFSIFLTSDFTMNQTFGGFMLISILAGYFADMMFLPALLKVFPSLYLKKARQERFKRLSHVAAQATGVILFSSVAFAAPEAKDILKKSQSLIDAKDDEATVEMKIIEANGEVKNRTLDLKSLRDQGFSLLARIQSPADIKDMAFLGQVNEEGEEAQWIYMPSSGQVRRLVTGKSKGGLLGSELCAEDLDSQAIKGASAKLLKSDSQFHWIEVKPASGASEYSKVVTKISVKDDLPKSTEYYVQSKLKKTISFNDYKKVGPVWRAQTLVVKNHLNHRGTEVRLSNMKVNSGLSKDDFSQSSLKEN